MITAPDLDRWGEFACTRCRGIDVCLTPTGAHFRPLTGCQRGKGKRTGLQMPH